MQEQRVQVSMDGKGRYLDNIFVERLWRSIKYEEVYLKAYQTVAEARTGINAYLELQPAEASPGFGLPDPSRGVPTWPGRKGEHGAGLIGLGET